MRITHVVETHLHNDYVTGGTPAWAQADLPVRTGQGQVM
jgi:hypothetical protein